MLGTLFCLIFAYNKLYRYANCYYLNSGHLLSLLQFIYYCVYYDDLYKRFTYLLQETLMCFQLGAQFLLILMHASTHAVGLVNPIKSLIMQRG